MVQMVFDPDFGWAAVDAQGNYDTAANAAIEEAREARGLDVRDPAMMYRPDLTTTPGARPGQAATYSANFGQIEDPLITLANLAKDPGAIGRQTGHVGGAGDALIKSIQEAAQKMAQGGQADPLAAALATEGLTPSYADQPAGDGRGQQYKEGDTRTDQAGNTYTFINGAWTQTATGEGLGEQTPRTDEWTPGYVDLWNRLNNGEITGTAEIQQLIDAGGFTPEEKGDLAQRAAIALMNAMPAGSDTAAVTTDLQALWEKYVAPTGVTGSAADAFGTWVTDLGWTMPGDGGGGGVDPTIVPPAQTGQDVGAYWSSVFEGAMQGVPGSWESKIDAVASALYNNPDMWAERPGMAGLNPQNFSLQEIKQWLTDTAWTSIPEDERTRLTGAYGGNSPVPGLYTIKGAPSAQPPGTQPPGTQPPGTQPPGTQPPGTQPPGAQPPGAQPPGTQPGVVGGPSTSGAPKSIEEMLGMFVDPAGERSFSEIYPGFAASQAGYGIPTVQQAYQQAAAPLQTQYSMQLPNLLKQLPGVAGVGDILSGTGMNYQSPQDFLESLAGGTGRVLGGSDLFGSLQNIGQALSMDPLSQNYLGMDPSKQLQSEMWRSLFAKPAQQVSAFAQPFLMATRGAPEARKALTDAISRAGARFGYQNPLGVDGQSFLPWALGQNLMGIKGMFTPGSAKQNPGWVPGGDQPLAGASAPGVYSQPFWASPEGAKRQEWDVDLGI
jgi:hypothetical protein